MNRRTLLKKAASVLAVGAAAPVALKAVEPSNRVYYGEVSCAPTASAPPPLDTRTPEQVYADSINDEANGVWHDALGEWTKHYRYVRRVSIPVFDKLVSKLDAEAGGKISFTTFSESEVGVVINGIVIIRS